MEELKNILILFTIMITFNCFTSFFLWRSLKNDFSRKAFLFWLFEFINFIVVALSSETGLVFLFKIFINVTSWYYLFSLAADLYEIKFNKRHYFGLFLFGYLFTLIFYFNGQSFPYYATPPVIAIVLYAQYILYKAARNKWRTDSVLGKSLLVVWFLLTLHSFGYPFLAHIPEVAVIGFTIYASFIFAIAVYLPSLILDRFRISQSNELENKVEERTNQLLEQVKMVSIGRLAGGLAHEVNNPLATIMASSESISRVMGDKTIDTQLLSSRVNTINKSVERIKKITTDLLHYSQEKKTRILLQKIDISEIIEFSLGLCSQKFILAGIKLDILKPKKPLLLLADKNLISEALIHFLDNSYNSIVNSPSPWIRVEALVADKKIRIIITDSGHGIDKTELTKIFDPFYTTDENQKAIGLGLSVAIGIINEHGGTARVDSSCNNTSFVIEFPPFN